jgi:phage protein D
VPGVTYRLTIDDASPAPALVAAIRQLEVEDHADEADMLRLRLATAVRPDGGGWTVLDDDVFPRLAKVRVWVVIGDTAVPLIEAHVIEVQADLSDRPDASTLTIVGMDPTVLMHLEERVRAWPDMTDADVASAIFGDPAYGFTPVVEPTRWTRHEEEQTLMQRGTDIAFLQQLARRNGCECFVELNADTGEVEGHFHPPRLDESPQGVLTVNMGAASNVNRFTVRHDMLGPALAEVSGIDTDAGETQPARADRDEDTTLGGDSAVAQDRPRRVLLARTGMGQGGELQAYARAVVERAAFSLEAEGELDAVAYGGVLRAKRPIMVRGVGRRYSGTWYVERVLHLFGPAGYVQRFTLRRNAIGLTGRERFTEDAALA